MSLARSAAGTPQPGNSPSNTSSAGPVAASRLGRFLTRKSPSTTAWTAVVRYLFNSRVFAESAPNHPLLVAGSDRMGAAVADIHEIHSADSFAAAALGRLESFLESAGCDVLYVFESHRIQSTV